jgi:hypothetical protein
LASKADFDDHIIGFMFEQESYKQDIPEAPTQPGDLFHNYEIRNWNFTPRLYKILAGSAIFNILALLVIGSSGMLTSRGCESPFVGRVCQVLDTVYVGTLIFGTEKEYADVDYDPTELEDADVTFVDVTGVSPPLTYPAGYFQIANPEQQFANVTDPMGDFSTPGFVAPGIPSSPPMINTAPVGPSLNPNPIQGKLPTDGPAGPSTDNPTIARNRKRPRSGSPMSGADPNTSTDPTDANSNSTEPKPADEKVAENAEEAKQDDNGIFINKRPLKDKSKETLAQVDAGKVKLDNPFRVVISGTLGYAKDGKTVILKNPKPEPLDKNFKADPALTKLAQEWVVAVGDAGWYGYLGVLDEKKGVGRKVTITIEQNDATFLANLKAEQPTPEHARNTASGLNGMMTLGSLGANEDQMTFLKSTKTSAEGSFLVVNFTMPKPEVQQMIQRKLAESKEKEVKPNGNASVKPNDNTAKK